MKTRIRLLFCVMLALAAALLTSGCMSVTAEELYKLPEASEEYLKLQQQIDAVLDAGAEYSPPASGMNRQSVQLKDLDGDGTPEALAFFTATGEKPMKLYIFKSQEDSYVTAAVIEGDGTGFESIGYPDMDGDGISELVIGWQMGASLQLMTLYSIRNFQPAQIASANYSQLVINDMNGDGNSDIVALSLSGTDMSGQAECITMMADGEVVSSTALLSNGIESIAHTVYGELSGGSPALFVDSVYGGSSVITDIILWNEGKLVNLTMNPLTTASDVTVRAYSVYCADMADDGVVELPYPRALVSQSDTSYRVLDWYAMTPQAYRRFIMTTYHNYSDGWYLVLPRDWADNISVRREDGVSGERTLVFSRVDFRTDKIEDFLKIYTLSGDNKEERAALNGRFILRYDGATVYAAEILVDAESYELSISQSIITSGFNMIYSDWNT